MNVVVQVAVETVTKAVDVMSRKMSALIKTKMDEKQDKETGKGLSTNDFTNAYKATLDNAVTGVKGDKEDTYRSGNVNITPANIGAVPVSSVGTANGVAELDTNGKVLSSQLPSYVDDVLEYASVSAFPATGESGKIYVSTDTNLSYRWTGSGYVEISPSLALGETSSTAYRGDRGKTAYDHSQTTGNAHNMVKADIGLGNVDNTSDANKPVSTAQQAALDLKQNKETGKGLSTNDYTNADKAKVAAALTEHQDISGKVDKVSGKGLSTNDYTDADKNAVAAIGNKVDKVTGKGLSTNDYTTAEKNKLSGIAAEANKTIIDDTLSNAGQAADAKTTGDSLSALQSLISRMEIYCEASGNPATFYDADAANVKALSITLTPTQSGSGDPSPTNIRPITGVSSVSVTRNGKNWADLSSMQTTTHNGITFTVSKDAAGNVTEIDANGTSTANNAWILLYNVRGLEKCSGMILSGAPAGINSKLLIEKNSSPYTDYAVDTGTGATIQNIPEGTACYFGWIFPTAGTTANHVKCYPMIRPASESDATFEAYQGQTVTVTLTDGSNPLTVYGGTLNVTAGTLTVTHKSVTLNGTETFWTKYGNGATDTSAENYRFFTTPAPDALIPETRYESGVVLCDTYAPTNANTLFDRAADRGVAIPNRPGYPFNGRIVIRDIALADITPNEFAAHLAQQPVMVVYPLATPLTYQLTPQQLATLHGYNGVSSDAGSVDVTYKVDNALIPLGGIV